MADLVRSCLHMACQKKTAHVNKNSPVIITLVTGGGFKVGMVILLSSYDMVSYVMLRQSNV